MDLEEEKRRKQREAVAAYRKKYPERVKATQKKYMLLNKEKRYAAAVKWQKENKVRHLKNGALWKLNNKERVKQKVYEWYKKNRARFLLAKAKWRKENPEASRRYNNNRRARILGNGGTLSKGIIEKLYVLQRGKCCCCRLSLGDDFHLDHILPLALGGRNDDNNVQLLRNMCNRQKFTKHPIEFMQQRGFLL